MPTTTNSGQPGSEGFVLTGTQIHDYRYIATVHGLRMEIHQRELFGSTTTAGPTRGMALASAKRILVAEGKLRPRQRITRKGALELMEQVCKDKGLPVTRR